MLWFNPPTYLESEAILYLGSSIAYMKENS